MQKRKPGQPHKGWKSAARKSRQKMKPPKMSKDHERSLLRQIMQ